ncbi:hypothetical protein, partial [Campylobacter concisus]|uniref:hypothetical protein n=1 Tax=Campylobacter concisus TaxID=199 RepID=UPI001CA58074
ITSLQQSRLKRMPSQRVKILAQKSKEITKIKTKLAKKIRQKKKKRKKKSQNKRQKTKKKKKKKKKKKNQKRLILKSNRVIISTATCCQTTFFNFLTKKTTKDIKNNKNGTRYKTCISFACEIFACKKANLS